MDERGQVIDWILVVVLIFFLLLIFGLIIPLGQGFLVGTYSATSPMIESAKEDALQIQDTESRDRIVDSLDAQQSGIVDNQNILGFFIQYAWVIILIAIVLIVFMTVKQRQEYSSQV